MEHQTTDPDSMVGGVVVADSDTTANPTRRPTRTQGRKLSVRDLRRPADLARSRRVGLEREVCIGCGTVRGPEGRTTHHEMCHAVVLPHMDAYWTRQHTGPIANRETSWDTGWHSH